MVDISEKGQFFHKLWQRIKESSSCQSISQLKDELDRLRYNYLLSDSFACFLAGLFFLKLHTDPNIPGNIHDLSLILSIFFYALALLIVFILLLSRLPQIKDLMFYMADWFHRIIVGPALLPGSLVIAFIEFMPTLIKTELNIWLIVTCFLGFLFLVALVIQLGIRWTKPLLVLRLKIGALMLIMFSLVNLYDLPVTNQELTLSLLNQSKFYVIAAGISLFTALIIESIKKSNVSSTE